MDNLLIPIFPLNGVIFFPESNLPLNIFENRYLDMINFSLSTNKLIGMIQFDENNIPYKIGCVGKINQFKELDNGNYLINLKGKNFFSIIKEISTLKKFRLAKVKIKNFKEKKTIINKITKYNRKILLKKYQKYVDKYNLQIDINLISRTPDVDLIQFISMTCPFSTADKQMLLEAFDLKSITEKLIGLFDFYTSIKESGNELN